MSAKQVPTATTAPTGTIPTGKKRDVFASLKAYAPRIKLTRQEIEPLTPEQAAEKLISAFEKRLAFEIRAGVAALKKKNPVGKPQEVLCFNIPTGDGALKIWNNFVSLSVPKQEDYLKLAECIEDGLQTRLGKNGFLVLVAFTSDPEDTYKPPTVFVGLHKFMDQEDLIAVWRVEAGCDKTAYPPGKSAPLPRDPQED